MAFSFPETRSRNQPVVRSSTPTLSHVLLIISLAEMPLVVFFLRKQATL